MTTQEWRFAWWRESGGTVWEVEKGGGTPLTAPFPSGKLVLGEYNRDVCRPSPSVPWGGRSEQTFSRRIRNASKWVESTYGHPKWRVIKLSALAACRNWEALHSFFQQVSHQVLIHARTDERFWKTSER
mgnify:CR=1 FL=1